MRELQVLADRCQVELAGTKFTTRILLNGRVYFKHPNNKVYMETRSAGVDTGLRYLSSWNSDSILFHEGNPYSYIVLGDRIADITDSFDRFNHAPLRGHKRS